jgi:hypothetical protein
MSGRTEDENWEAAVGEVIKFQKSLSNGNTRNRRTIVR